jgi:hypothetical protein
MKNVVKTETTKIAAALGQFKKTEEQFQNASNEKTRLEELIKKISRNYIMCKYQFKSFISMFISFTEYLLFGLPNKLGSTENEYMLNILQALLIEKIQGISKTIEDMELSYEISQVKSWKSPKGVSELKTIDVHSINASPSRNNAVTKTGMSLVTIVLREDISKAEKKRLQESIVVIRLLGQATSSRN